MDSNAQNNTNERTLDVINKIAEFAKLDKNDMKPAVQIIRFSPLLNEEDVKLLELDSDCLQLLEVGDRLVLRGEKNEGAVLCTSDRTYELKDAETSNALLLVPEMQFSETFTDTEQTLAQRDVCAVLHNYYEIRPCKPKIKKLRELLETNMFSGYECEEDEEHTGHKYTWSEILDSVQASEEEMKQEIKKLNALELDGFVRMFHCDYVTRVLSHLTQLVDENSWPLDRVPLTDCVATLQEIIPGQIVQHVLECYGSRADVSIDEVFYTLNEEKICRLFAELILRHTEKFNLQEFLEAWQQSVPTGMMADLSQLEGMGLVDRSSKPEVIKYFPVDDLPESPNERFDTLFRTREKWTLEDITPYINDLTSDKMNVGALLLKFARASTLNGVKVYNSKRPIL